ncbi:MAG: peptidoglycan-binding domain-containing protein [Thermodesulfobacteriota bacterium]
MSRRRPNRLLACCAAAAALVALGCSVPSDEERAKAAEAKAKESLIAIDDGALEQQVDPAVVKKVQEQLTVLNEYMGPVNGKLDQVTINAFEAFQRSNELTPDGMFAPKTLRLLDEAAAAKAAGAGRTAKQG